MDASRAKSYATVLIGTEVGGWRIEEVLGHGKSGVVFVATKGKERAALKVFDDELLAQYGRDVQLERIKRELTLRGHDHPNLIPILDGGICAKSHRAYVVTRLLEDWRTIEDCLQEIPASAVASIIDQVAAAARFLEERDCVHRDIKPANILVSPDFSQAVLLDLGVLRPLDASDLTGEDEFIGTLQYSSPEFLFREEEQTKNGGRALTFYQLGAVLHDLLLRKPLFGDMQPYSKMVDAVRSLYPPIVCPSQPTALVQLARNCLLKHPDQRLALVSWDDFTPAGRSRHGDTAEIRRRVRERRGLPLSIQPVNASPQPRLVLCDFAQQVIDRLQDTCAASSDLPPLRASLQPCGAEACNVMLLFASSARHQLSRPLHFLFRMTCSFSSPQVATVAAAAALTDEMPEDLADKCKVVFEGVADADAVHDDILNYVYRVIDEAQVECIAAQPGYSPTRIWCIDSKAGRL